MFSFLKNKKSNEDKDTLSVLPHISKLPETTFLANGREYWLGMSVSESGLMFRNSEDANKMMEPNGKMSFPSCGVVDSEDCWFEIGLINRGTQSLPYKDCEICSFLISTDDFETGLVFFNGVTQSSLPHQFLSAFEESSFELEPEEDDIGEDFEEEEKCFTCTYTGSNQKISFEFFEDDDEAKDGICDILGIIKIECF